MHNQHKYCPTDVNGKMEKSPFFNRELSRKMMFWNLIVGNTTEIMEWKQNREMCMLSFRASSSIVKVKWEGKQKFGK